MSVFGNGIDWKHGSRPSDRGDRLGAGEANVVRRSGTRSCRSTSAARSSRRTRRSRCRIGRVVDRRTLQTKIIDLGAPHEAAQEESQARPEARLALPSGMQVEPRLPLRPTWPPGTSAGACPPETPPPRRRARAEPFHRAAWTRTLRRRACPRSSIPHASRAAHRARGTCDRPSRCDTQARRIQPRSDSGTSGRTRTRFRSDRCRRTATNR